MANTPGQLENSMFQNLEIPRIHPLNKSFLELKGGYPIIFASNESCEKHSTQR